MNSVSWHTRRDGEITSFRDRKLKDGRCGWLSPPWSSPAGREGHLALFWRILVQGVGSKELKL